MKNGLVIADSGAIISLASIRKLEILNSIFDNVVIPLAVWEEIILDEGNIHHHDIHSFFHDKVQEIKGFNELTFIMDYGESESVILYRELNADFLLIDDKKARKIAENLGLNCIGTIGILINAKQKGIIQALKPLFEEFLRQKRCFSLDLLNKILEQHQEQKTP